MRRFQGAECLKPTSITLLKQTLPEPAAKEVHEQRLHYSRAPILEAVIDVHARLPASANLDALGSIKWDGEGRYSKRAPRFHGNIEFSVEVPTPTVTTTPSQIGFVFRDEQRGNTVQARLDGFALSKLPPYDRWEPFCGEARSLWKRYCEVAKPLGVTRIAVRYINRLELPVPILDFRDYLRTYPEVSPDLPQMLSGFVLQLQIPQEDILDCMLILNEGLLESPKPDIAGMLLDIDLFRPVTLSPTGDELWVALEELHVRKNAVFEACITDKTRELIR